MIVKFRGGILLSLLWGIGLLEGAAFASDFLFPHSQEEWRSASPRLFSRYVAGQEGKPEALEAWVRQAVSIEDREIHFARDLNPKGVSDLFQALRLALSALNESQQGELLESISLEWKTAEPLFRALADLLTVGKSDEIRLRSAVVIREGNWSSVDGGIRREALLGEVDRRWVTSFFVNRLDFKRLVLAVLAMELLSETEARRLLAFAEPGDHRPPTPNLWDLIRAVRSTRQEGESPLSWFRRDRVVALQTLRYFFRELPTSLLEIPDPDWSRIVPNNQVLRVGEVSVDEMKVLLMQLGNLLDWSKRDLPIHKPTDLLVMEEMVSRVLRGAVEKKRPERIRSAGAYALVSRSVLWADLPLFVGQERDPVVWDHLWLGALNYSLRIHFMAGQQIRFEQIFQGLIDTGSVPEGEKPAILASFFEHSSKQLQWGVLKLLSGWHTGPDLTGVLKGNPPSETLRRLYSYLAASDAAVHTLTGMIVDPNAQLDSDPSVDALAKRGAAQVLLNLPRSSQAAVKGVQRVIQHGILPRETKSDAPGTSTGRLGEIVRRIGQEVVPERPAPHSAGARLKRLRSVRIRPVR